MATKKETRIFAVDSNGNTLSLRRACLKNLLKKRRAVYVEPEVREVIARRKRTLRVEPRVKDIALELCVRFHVIRRIMDKLAVEGVVEQLKVKDASVGNVKFKIL